MSRLTHNESSDRWKEVYHLVERIEDDPVAYHFARLYAMGDIITLEECLCQMVRGLRETNAKLKNELLSRAMRNPDYNMLP